MTRPASRDGGKTPDTAGGTLEAFREESDAFIGALAELPMSAWDRRTRCDPWQVRDVVAHVITVLARVPDMIAAPAPARPDTTATDYYRADHRFSDTANADRIRMSQQRAAVRDATSLVQDLTVTAQSVITHCRQEPIGRIVETRHGDAMLLPEFLSTRIVELAVHGLDVADAAGRRPWLTTAAAEHLQRLLFGPDWLTSVTALGWDAVTLVRKTTGRGPVTAQEDAELRRRGLRRLTLG
ncbi:maleylpyruvate isomerase N-terminal domain-containing protein [Actinoplanes sp. N902-109]|uniref:maleylpyruvate isomerase N-terminal domain-containing protein n=1 Tax=Actinoplanes sp. (strain N902-109) TaxID=649831 RepID=UPI00267CDC9C